jgi:hypothetical protein
MVGLNPQFGGLFRAVAEDDVIPQGDGFTPLKVSKGDLLFASFKNAHLNVSNFSWRLSHVADHIPVHQPVDFPNPDKVDPTRPRERYQLQGAGFHNCPGVTYAEQVNLRDGSVTQFSDTDLLRPCRRFRRSLRSSSPCPICAVQTVRQASWLATLTRRLMYVNLSLCFMVWSLTFV